MILASDLNMQLKMNVCILYILCSPLHFICFLFIPEPFLPPHLPQLVNVASIRVVCSAQ